MPLYEFRCAECEAKETVFTRTVASQPVAPMCSNAACGAHGLPMVRAVSTFQRHMTLADKSADAEARWGKEVDAAMGPEPDVGRYARRLEALSRDLPPGEPTA